MDTCPFTADRLRELYWIERKTAQEIADLAGDAMDGTEPSARTVYNWMRNRRIGRRTRREAQILYDEAHPARLVEMRSSRRRANCGPAHLARANRRVCRKAGRTKSLGAKETRQCAYPGCTVQITRPRWRFRRSPERTFCSATHSSRWYQKYRCGMIELCNTCLRWVDFAPGGICDDCVTLGRYCK